MDHLTKNDKATDSNLDGGSLSPRQSEGTSWCPVCKYIKCTFEPRHDTKKHEGGWHIFCSCIYCQTCRVEFSRDDPEMETFHDIAIRRLMTVDAHNTKLSLWKLQQQKQATHDQNKANAQSKLGPREFTLTYGHHFEDDETAQAVMRKAMERLTKYYKDEIIEFHAVGEFTDAGRAHVHGWYHLDGGRKITDKNFKRAYPPWNPKRKLGKGHEGGHHATIDRVSDFAGYAEKHLEEAWLKVDITRHADATQGPQTPSRILAQVDGSDDSSEEGHSSC